MEILKELVILEPLSRNNPYTKSFASDTTHAMDLGALTPFLGIWGAWKTYEFYERVSEPECTQHSYDQAEYHMMPLGLLNDIIIF